MQPLVALFNKHVLIIWELRYITICHDIPSELFHKIWNTYWKISKWALSCASYDIGFIINGVICQFESSDGAISSLYSNNPPDNPESIVIGAGTCFIITSDRQL